MDLTRRRLLALGGLSVTGVALAPRLGVAQGPKRGGTLTQQQYYVQSPSAMYVAVWDAALKNYGPNIGFDYGGRLTAAWLDR